MAGEHCLSNAASLGPTNKIIRLGRLGR